MTNETNDVANFEDIDLSETTIEADTPEGLEGDFDKALAIEEEGEKKKEAVIEDENDETDADDIQVDQKKEEEVVKEEEKPKLDLKKEKIISAKFGEDQVEIPANAVITHKVDGEDREFTVQELLNQEAGKIAYDKKFSELGNEKKSFYAERDDMIDKASAFATAVQDRDAEKSIEALATLTGSNPIELRKNFLDIMRDQATQYLKLTPEQQKELDMESENKYLRERDEHREASIAEQQQQAQELADLTNQVTAFRDKLGIDDARLVALKDELEAKSQDITFEALEELHHTSSSQGKASEILNGIDPSLIDADGYLDEVADFVAKNPDLSDAEVADCIKEALEGESEKESTVKKTSSAAKTIQGRINKSNPNTTKESKKQVSTEELDDVVDFGDVDHDYNF